MTTPSYCDITHNEAWAVFTDNSDIPALHLLRPGFRHCYVIARDSQGWYSMDPMMNYVDVGVFWDVARDFDMPGWLLQKGHVVMPVMIDRSRERMVLGPYTCVSIVKRFLGVHKPWIVTPYQLYKHLGREAHKCRIIYNDFGFKPLDAPNTVLRMKAGTV